MGIDFTCYFCGEAEYSGVGYGSMHLGFCKKHWDSIVGAADKLRGKIKNHKHKWEHGEVVDGDALCLTHKCSCGKSVPGEVIEVL